MLKSNSAFMDTDEPIICRGLDRMAVCAVGHSLSKHMEHTLPPHLSVCARVRKRKRIFSPFLWIIGHLLTVKLEAEVLAVSHEYIQQALC